MTEEKRNRLIGAVAVNTVLLLAILLAFAMYQFVYMGVLTVRKSSLQKELQSYESKIDEGDQIFENLQNNENSSDALFEAIIFLYGNSNENSGN